MFQVYREKSVFKRFVFKDRNGNIVKDNIDPFASQDFNINEFGHIRNDVSALQQAQSRAEFEMIASRLVEIDSDVSNEGLSDTEILANIQSRYIQTPAELIRFAEYKAKQEIARTIPAEPSEGTIKFESEQNVNN